VNSVLYFLVAVALLVFIHELGHYLAARSVGVHVERFSVGFGRTILRLNDRRGCEWAVGWIPLGGYVKMWDASGGGDAPALAGPNGSFHSKALWARSWVVVAGPLANFIFAVFAFGVVAGIDRHEPQAILGQPAEGSIAARAGLLGGESVQAVNGVAVETFSDVRWQIFRVAISGADAITLSVAAPGGSARSLTLPIDPRMAPDVTVTSIGLQPVSVGVRITGTVPEGAGARAGLSAGMVVLSVDGAAVRSPSELVDRVQASRGESLSLGVVETMARAPGEEVPGSGRLLTVTPTVTADGVYRLGVGIGAQSPTVLVDRSALAALDRGFWRTAEVSQLSLQALWRMLSGDLSWRQLNGPVAIADAAGQSASIGLVAFLGFLALVSVSIGILNLLPIPMLDGGHLLYYFYELLRGKPLPEQVQAAGQRIGLMLVLGLTGLALLNDFSRFFGL
jgi:regulator of sigma E protease